MRTSKDDIIQGRVYNGFDYSLQCWIKSGIIQRCGHPESMRCNCYGRAHAGESIFRQPAAENRPY